MTEFSDLPGRTEATLAMYTSLIHRLGGEVEEIRTAEPSDRPG